jgi:hypothetical protein
VPRGSSYTIRQDKTRQDKARQGKERQLKTRQDKTRQDKTRQEKTRQDKTRQDKTRQEQEQEQRQNRIPIFFFFNIRHFGFECVDTRLVLFHLMMKKQKLSLYVALLPFDCLRIVVACLAFVHVVSCACVFLCVCVCLCLCLVLPSLLLYRILLSCTPLGSRRAVYPKPRFPFEGLASSNIV